jgi:hypothetical protein
MKTAMQELIEDINIEKRLGYITENAANRILDYINNLYLEQEKEQIANTYWDAYKEGQVSSDITAEEYYNREFNQEKVSPQDTVPAICNYSGLRPVEGYKEETK